MSACRFTLHVSCWTQQNFKGSVNLTRIHSWLPACPILPCLSHFLQSLETNGYDVTLIYLLTSHIIQWGLAGSPDGSMYPKYNSWGRWTLWCLQPQSPLYLYDPAGFVSGDWGGISLSILSGQTIPSRVRIYWVLHIDCLFLLRLLSSALVIQLV